MKNKILRKYLGKIFDFFVYNNSIFIALVCRLKKLNLYNFSFDFPQPQNTKQSVNGSKDINIISLAKEKINKACVRYLISKYYRLNESKRKEFLENHIWGSKPGERWNRRIEAIYNSSSGSLKSRERLINCILSFKKNDYKGIIEIGTSNGWFLNILSQKIKRDIKFTGLDINYKTIKRAKLKYKDNNKLDFKYTDIYNYAKTNDLKNKIIISCITLIYFSQKELKDFCKLLSKHKPCYLAIVELVNKISEGSEQSIPLRNFIYSHNYEKIFTKLGMKKIFSFKEYYQNKPDYLHLTALYKY